MSRGCDSGGGGGPAPGERAGAGYQTTGTAGGENPALSSGGWKVSSSGARGSFEYDDPERSQWERETVLEREYDYHHANGTYAYSALKGRRADGDKAFLQGRRVHGTSDLQFAQDEGELYKFPGIEHYRKGAGDEPDLLYRLPELLATTAERPHDPIFICEGEKDVDRLWAAGLIATTNPKGALNWKPEFNATLAGRNVVILTDNDDKGRKRTAKLLPMLAPVAGSVKALDLPNLPERGDVSDWLDAGNTVDDLLREVSTAAGSGVHLTDFYAFMPSHNYIFAPNGESWPATSVNSRIAPVPLMDRDGQPLTDDRGKPKRIAANQWLDANRSVEQMTWAPGEPQVISDRLISDGGWIARAGCSVFNLYRPPLRLPGDGDKAQPWVDHVRRVYPNDADHIIYYLAHRVQLPGDKINHAIVLGGAQGIGKDTILEPVKHAVGPWNFAEVSPQHLLGRFNSFVKSVILRISEARDLGDVDRFAFYDHMKTYTAAPPDVLRVDEKFQREYSAFNVCGVVITTNHKGDGLYLPEDDRRHYVAWSEASRDDFSDQYWTDLHGWYDAGGVGHVAAYLGKLDLAGFNPKAPPPKTDAFWDIVTANSAPESAELTDALEKLGWPPAVTLTDVRAGSDLAFTEWLSDRRNSRKIPHKMEECGYRNVRNPNARSGRWKVGGKDMNIYAKRELTTRDALQAAEALIERRPNDAPI